MTLRVDFFRHGRTQWNADGRFQGIADAELDDLGKAQALAVAQRCQEIRPVALYSSDLQRCSYVAGRIAERVEIGVTLDERLRERDVGQWSGFTRAEIIERWPEDFERWTNAKEDVRPGGGETMADVVERVESFMGTIRETHDDGTCIAVTHGGWLRALLEWVFRGGVSGRNLETVTQASLTTVVLAPDGTPKLEAYNDRGHLLGLEDVDRKAPAPAVF